MIPMIEQLGRAAALLAGAAVLAACAGAPAADPAAPEQPAPAAAQIAAPAAGDEQFQLANPSGELIPVEQVLVRGKVTVLDFYADWCAPCKVLDKKLREQIHDEPRIAVRKIDVGKAEPDAVISRYGVKNLPHVRIYAPDGRLLHDLVGTQAEQTGRLARDALTSL